MQRGLWRTTGRYLVTVLVLGAVLSGVPEAAGQLPTASILGVVRDSSGAVIPGVAMTVTNTETGLTRSSQTANDGSFRFPALAVGTYNVRAEHPGFQAKVQQNLRITVGQDAVLNISLDVGAVTETVSVTAEAPIVNTTSGTLGGLVGEQTVSDLPLDGRNFNDLTLLQTGVAESRHVGTTGTYNGTMFSSNGAPIRSNMFMIDGTIMNDAHNTGAASSNENTLGVEGIREFRVVTNAFSAEYGMSMGSQISLVTKGGTNELHGSLFEYLRNSALDAPQWQDNAFNKGLKPAFRRNNFGGSLGGPIRSDKLFYFLTYEGLRQGRGVTLVGNVPTLAARQDGGLVQRVSDAVKPYLAFYPAPTGADLGQGLGRYSRAVTNTQAEDMGQGRVDFNISSADTLFGRYTISDSNAVNPELIEPLAMTLPGRNQWLTISDNHIFTPSLLATFRASFSRTRNARVPTLINAPALAFLPGATVLGGLGISQVADLTPDRLAILNQRIISFSTDMFHTAGRHSLKYGTLINFYRQYLNNAAGFGSWSFANLAAFLEARPTSFSAPTPGTVADRTYDYDTLGFYLQDDLRLLDTFTLNLGLRYEITTQTEETHDNGAALRNLQRDAQVTPGIAFKNPSLGNISPRFGFAWDVRGNGQTALRGGFGLLYDIGGFGTALFIGANATPPLSSQSEVTPANGLVFMPFPPIPAGLAGRTLRTLDYAIQQPHLLSYNLTLDRQLPLGMGLTLAYAGSRGINIMANKEGNPTVQQGTPQNGVCLNLSPPPAYRADGPKCWLGTESRTNPNWGSIDFRTAASNSWYNSLQMGVTKRLNRGLQFQNSYTWSHALDETQGQLGGPEGQTGGGATGDDPSNRRHDKGSAMFDFRHQWRFNALYHFPSVLSGGWGKLANGWWMSGIITWNSGFPFDPVLSRQRSRSGTGGSNGGTKRPDLVAGVKYEDITRGMSRGCIVNNVGIAAGTPLGTPTLFFDPCAYAIPAIGFLGTSGRFAVYGPNFSGVNFSVVKDTPLPLLGEGGSVQFRTEIFNLPNHPSMGIPARAVYTAAASVEPPITTAGQITTTSSKSREVQFALKLIF